MRISAWLMRSAETTGPIVVSDACSAIGPSSFCSAATISAPLPDVGSSVLPVGVEGDADAPAAPEPDGAGEPDAAELDDGAGEAEGGADCGGEAEGAGEPDAVDADPLAAGLPL